jgi:uncharacterized membrane protein
MLRFRSLLVCVLAGLLLSALTPSIALADSSSGLTISTNYPSLIIGVGETVSLNMQVSSPSSEIVTLNTTDLPKGWTAEFRGGGKLIRSVFVDKSAPSAVELRVVPPADVTPGTFDFKVTAKGAANQSEFPIELVVKEKVPVSLSLTTDFPTLRGGSDSPFNFNATLKNDGGDDVSVVLSSDAPKDFVVKFTSSGKDITGLPTDIKAGSSQPINISVQPLTSLSVGDYPINIQAQSDAAQAFLTLTAEVTGESQLDIATSDGRLSGDAYLGKTTPIKLILRNTGNSPAAGVKLTATSPSGWTVTLNPTDVVEVPANGEVNITANVKPADQAIAGDYMLTFRAQPNDGAAKSEDFRVTVRTSTLWGIVGIALIAVAIAIVGMAVVRFGRR